MFVPGRYLPPGRAFGQAGRYCFGEGKGLYQVTETKRLPVFLPDEKKYIKAEVQFRTIAMDFWASLEHKLKYKKSINNTEDIEQQLKACADSIEELDYQMQEIRNKIDNSVGVDFGGNS